MAEAYVTARYILNPVFEGDYDSVLVTDKHKTFPRRSKALERWFRRDNARKLMAMIAMEADDEALFLALRSMGMYNLPHKDRYKKNG